MRVMRGNCVIVLYCFNEIIFNGDVKGLYFVSLGVFGVLKSFLMFLIIIVV